MIVVRFKVQSKPEETEQLMDALHDVIAPSRQIEGRIEFDIGRCLDDPELVHRHRGVRGPHRRWTVRRGSRR